jgi:RNA polymerase sigma-70 factor (ECF subfamily)
LEGLSIQETAEAMQITENNVKTRLLRARLRLRQELAIYYAEKVEKEKSK